MNCLRCGRETDDKQVFCVQCLADMARYPVRPDTPVHLPLRKAVSPQRKNSRHQRKDGSPEEMLILLQRRIRVLWATVIILFMMLSAAAIGVLVARQQGLPLIIPNIGQNYQTADDSTVSTAP